MYMNVVKMQGGQTKVVVHNSMVAAWGISSHDVPQGVTAWCLRFTPWQYLQADHDVGQASGKLCHVAALTQLSLVVLNGRTSSICSCFPLICCKAYMSPWLKPLQSMDNTQQSIDPELCNVDIWVHVS